MARLREKVRRELSGETISQGVAIADALVFKPIALEALEMNSFPIDDLLKEITRLDYAIQKSENQLLQIFDRLKGKKESDVSEIFQVQLQLLRDQSFIDEIKNLLKAQKMNIEHVIASKMRVLETRFKSITDEVMRTRFLDIQDVYHRILRNLLEIEHVRTNPMQRIENPVIFVAEKLLPSDVALLDFSKIVGIIIEEGSRFSHVAVISKSMNIPAIIRTPGAGTLIKTGDPVIVDGYTAKVVVFPNESELSVYKEKREYFLSSIDPKSSRLRSKICQTRDGRRIKLEANIGSVNEAQIAMKYGAEGVGLLRTELFYMSCKHQPSVDEEVRFYTDIISILKNRPLTIRLLDLGADKSLPFLKSYEEENPQLGIRGIRYLLNNKELFKNHLKSVVLVSKITRIKILLPFVAIIEDLDQALSIIDEVCRETDSNKDDISVGIMVEIPSVALSINTFLQKVDFVNVGTNDLVQYVFAASREDSGLEDYRQSMHPVILKIISHIVESGIANDKEVSVCGEAASDPMLALLMVGAGVTSLSMQPSSIVTVKDAINHWEFSHLFKVFKEAALVDGSRDVVELINRNLKKSKR
ncbi:phosphoenolpyruvate--protein phosphotransferase [Chitinispirillales bacterium ANBcel5]|uniref:phosphoenolpyruvate--protein phosphotransferase n=1 Tax=Cellulosispirillum alkaliphilum TaxID=3039283 RepID=UPI002A561C81|nr:phosphoenolpyruvate--protein phosphotransferase [Chitinispirillales bacterium ANBcel5]